MIRALYTSATGMKAQELMIDNTANNLANVNTNGFKRSRIDFADLMYLTLEQPGADAAQGQPAPIGVEIGSGVKVNGTTKSFAIGNLENTGIDLNVAIQGDGFFQVEVVGGQRYTRDGAFQINQNGVLVTADGNPVGGQVTIPEDAEDITIAADGTVSVKSATGQTEVGKIPIYKFLNPAGLHSEGNNLYSETVASGTASEGDAGADGRGALLQGYIENSNVEVVTELISLIAAQRAYEINSRAIRAGDEMLSTTNEIVR